VRLGESKLIRDGEFINDPSEAFATADAIVMAQKDIQVVDETGEFETTLRKRLAKVMSHAKNAIILPNFYSLI
jgi:nucleoside-triphosphatase THEP1